MSVAAVGGAVAGGLISASGAKSAAGAQSNAANLANATQAAQYAQTRSDNMPFLINGTAGSNQLAYLLGLSPNKGSATPSLGNAQLVGAGGEKNDWLYSNNDAYRKAWDQLANEHFAKYKKGYRGDSNISSIEMQLRSMLAPQIAEEKARLAQESANAPNDPLYNSLNRKFSESDLAADIPFQLGHDYAQQQGNTGVNRIAAATGMQLSGATLKALERSGAQIANQYAGDARNRYVADQDSTYNRLAGLSSSGQTATAQVGAAGANAANNISQNQIGLGNARGASAIAQGNALSGAIGQGINTYQQNQFLNSLSNYGGYNDEMARLNAQARG